MLNPATLDPDPVVVGVTGTPAGLAAVRLAAREAVSRGRLLRIVHAFTWPASADPGLEGCRRAAVRVVDEAIATARRSTPRVRVTGQLVDGAPDRVLVRLSRSAGLLVLGDDDLSTLRWLPGVSVLVQTVARSWCPVLVARGPRPPAGPVLAAVDGSACSLLALRHAAAEAQRLRLPVEVVHVSAGPAEQSREMLVRAVAAVPGLTPVRVRVLHGEAPGPALVHASGKARVIVLGPRGEHDAGLLGSVAREVLHKATCPTIFVHGGKRPSGRIPAQPIGAPADVKVCGSGRDAASPASRRRSYTS